MSNVRAIERKKNFARYSAMLLKKTADYSFSSLGVFVQYRARIQALLSLLVRILCKFKVLDGWPLVFKIGRYSVVAVRTRKKPQRVAIGQEEKEKTGC